MTLGLFTAGCFQDPGPGGDDEVGDGDGDTGDTGGEDPVEPGACWCATVTDAKVDPPMGPPELIEDPENENESPRACLGASASEHADLLQIANGGDTAVVTALHTSVVPFRDLVFATAEAYCNELADAQAGEQDSDNDCEEILIPGTSPLVYHEDMMCPVVGADAPPDHWSDYYRLSMVIAQNPTNGVYEIDEAFFEDVLHNAWWLAQDNAYIALNTNLDFAFFSVQQGDVVHALGITAGDVPITLNNLDITSVTEVVAAYAALYTETEFELVVQRPGVGSVTLEYEVVP